VAKVVTAGRGQRWLLRLAIAAGTALGLGLVLFLLRAPLLTAFGSFLIVSDSVQQADLIYIMGGGLDARPLRAAELYQQGVAPRIVTPYVELTAAEEYGIRQNGALEYAALLRRLGVPDSAIQLLKTSTGSTSTLDDARILASYVRKNGFRRVVVVTSEFHTRRSRWAVRQFLPDSVDLMVAAADERGYTPRDWWRSEKGMLDVFEEYLKFVHNYTQR
jgi:uncharacterized SAM-binding protein YcdF (DUF218 family)